VLYQYNGATVWLACLRTTEVDVQKLSMIRYSWKFRLLCGTIRSL
jgi:hypothetical protein